MLLVLGVVLPVLGVVLAKYWVLCFPVLGVVEPVVWSLCCYQCWVLTCYQNLGVACCQYWVL